MKKIVTILGARPQFIKAAVLSRIISQYKDIEEVIVHTGQHYDSNMSAVFFDDMHIPKPKYNLDINGLSHGAMTGQMLEKIESILRIEKPQAVLVYGDTNSTLAGALAAKKMHIKVVHVEAGLRSFNMKMPEEINRIVTDRIADLLLCPTQKAMENLKQEGFDTFETRFVNCGDIMKEAVSYYGTKLDTKSTILNNLKLHTNQFILATIHRPENTDDKLKLTTIFKALDKINSDIKVVLPLHPRTKKFIEQYGIDSDIVLINPVGYFDMLALQKHCKLIVTDSGGLQKEAFFNKKFSIITREQTEWVELVANDFAKVVGSDYDKIIEAFNYFKDKEKSFDLPLYGTAVGQTIYDEILKLL
jgi:UDP-GlcNAc3NAcA epimerase